MSSDFDCVISGGTVATEAGAVRADVGIIGHSIAAVASDLGAGRRTIDARDRLVMPGAIETHCHIEQESATGAMTSDDYYSGSVSAAFGGHTTIVPFAAQHRGHTIPDVLSTYHERAGSKSILDYSFHLIVSDPTPTTLEIDLPAAIASGITSFKVFLTYDKMIVSDEQMLEILGVARRHGALTMVHAENNAMIKSMVGALQSAGKGAPKYHAVSHPAAAEIEAIGRSIQLANFADAPLLIVHVSTDEGANLVARARAAGRPIYGETCPQYFVLRAHDLDRPGAEGAKFICSPPLRDDATADALWRHLQAGALDLWSSDHSPYRFDETGKLLNGPNPAFWETANGLPGIELRVPILFTHGVLSGKIQLRDFVRLSAGTPARLFGMADRKGAIMPGLDADIAIWDPEEDYQVRADELHDNMDYSPYEEMALKGRVRTVVSRGEVIVDERQLTADRGRGQFLPRRPFDHDEFAAAAAGSAGA